MDILLFGAHGQLGAHLARDLSALGRVDALGRGDVDLCETESVVSAITSRRPGLVVNAAAYTAVDRAESEAELAHRVNAAAPGAMAKACASLGSWLVHYSTDYVFDGEAIQPYREDDATGPTSVYGRTKLQGEEAVRNSLGKHLIFRTAWVYANRGGNFLNTMLRLAGERNELNIVDDQHGGPTLAASISTATTSVCRALVDNTHGERSAGIYHMTCGGETTWYEFARRIFEHSGDLDRLTVNPIPTSAFPTPARRPGYSVLSNDKLRRVFNVSLPNWEDALAQCFRERAIG